VALADAPGNYVALDIGGGRYAFYEHLAPGLAVRPGQRVRRGQVIARVGSTGSASRPHLHLHVSDASAPLAAEGQPFELAGWRALGGYRSIDAFNRGEPWVESATPDAHPADAGFPSPNAVVVFD
jgi:murein DD-endopeptidase